MGSCVQWRLFQDVSRVSPSFPVWALYQFKTMGIWFPGYTVSLWEFSLPSLKALKLRITLLPHVCPEALLNSALAPLPFQLPYPSSNLCVLPLVLLRKLRLSCLGWEVRVREDTVFVQAITRGSSNADSLWPCPSIIRCLAGPWWSLSLAYWSCHCINFLSLCPQPAVTLVLVWCPLFWCPGGSFCELLLGSFL